MQQQAAMSFATPIIQQQQYRSAAQQKIFNSAYYPILTKYDLTYVQHIYIQRATKYLTLHKNTKTISRTVIHDYENICTYVHKYSLIPSSHPVSLLLPDRHLWNSFRFRYQVYRTFPKKSYAMRPHLILKWLQKKCYRKKCSTLHLGTIILY
jgi:hypothetical protein